jgi:hypothetical protein
MNLLKWIYKLKYKQSLLKVIYIVKAIKNCPKLNGNFCPRHDAICVQLRPWGQPQTPEFFAVIFPERVI